MIREENTNISPIKEKEEKKKEEDLILSVITKING